MSLSDHPDKIVFYHLGRLSILQQLRNEVDSDQIVDQADLSVRLRQLELVETQTANQYARTVESAAAKKPVESVA